MKIQICQACNRSLSVDLFHKCKTHSTGYKQRCKSCRSELEKPDLEKAKENSRRYRAEHPNANKEYYDSHPRYFEKYRRENRQHYSQWRRDNREKILAYLKDRREGDPSFKIKCHLRSRLSSLLSKSRAKKCKKTMSLLGCNIEAFKNYLKSKFQNGMTFDNYGKWHIDHIKPCASFDLRDPRQQEECFHFSNLQPLWAKDNLRK